MPARLNTAPATRRLSNRRKAAKNGLLEAGRGWPFINTGMELIDMETQDPKGGGNAARRPAMGASLVSRLNSFRIIGLDGERLRFQLVAVVQDYSAMLNADFRAQIPSSNLEKIAIRAISWPSWGHEDDSP